MKFFLMAAALFLVASFAYAGVPGKPAHTDFAKLSKSIEAKQLNVNKLAFNFNLTVYNYNIYYSDSDIYLSIWDDTISSYVFFGTIADYHSSTPDITDGDNYYITAYVQYDGSNDPITGSLRDYNLNVISESGGSNHYNSGTYACGSSSGEGYYFYIY